MINMATQHSSSAADTALDRYNNYCTHFPTLGLSLDCSCMPFDEAFLKAMETRMQKAFADMRALEGGSIANPDEKRMVGHYWLRNPSLAPTAEIQAAIRTALQAVKTFAARVHAGEIQGQTGRFRNVLLIGIGGSALGPQFVSHALGHPERDQMRMFFFDNTDPDGMARVLAGLHGELGQTLCIVISKSGGTKETANGMKEAQAAYSRAGLNFSEHAVAITQDGSQLDKHAINGKWTRRFPMWDWVGGRTSEISTVGLLPAALQGIDIQSIIYGACACDIVTRNLNVKENPSAQLALMWHASGNGKGAKNMVVVPYKDRLEWFTRYIQQLIMESIGKGKDLEGNDINQGICVFGNKGSTDQHSYIQQLREGLDNFFLTFIRVLKDSDGPTIQVESDVSSGDYLHSFLLGTKHAVSETQRGSLTISIETISPFSIGVLIALFERAVGFYASLVNINAYHQPGVEAGKKSAANILKLQTRICNHLRGIRGICLSAEDVFTNVAPECDVVSVHQVCEHLSHNPSSGIQKLPRPEGQFVFRSI